MLAWGRGKRPVIYVTWNDAKQYVAWLGRKTGKRFKLSNGEKVSIGGIWTINLMPKNGFSKEELQAVDMSEADEPAGPNGETLRKMISDTYHCTSTGEEERYIRRFIAS